MTPFVQASELYDPADGARSSVVDAAHHRWKRDAEPELRADGGEPAPKIVLRNMDREEEARAIADLTELGYTRGVIRVER